MKMAITKVSNHIKKGYAKVTRSEFSDVARDLHITRCVTLYICRA